MSRNSKGKSNQKNSGLHPRNSHRNPYDFDALCKTYPNLERFVQASPRGGKTIDFSNSKAVVALNSALLKRFYKIRDWSLPAGNLCPPVPGRVDYIHYLNDLLDESKEGHRVLDIGTGANLIYPLLGASVYQWNVVASDIDASALENAAEILQKNPQLTDLITLRQQADPKKVFHGLIRPDEFFHAVLCNPPFHRSVKEAAEAAESKRSQLLKARSGGAVVSSEAASKKRNFGGRHHELWCEGGELGFIHTMIKESCDFSKQVGWFTSLVSKKDHLTDVLDKLNQYGVRDTKVIKMQQGQKHSRFVAWRF